MAPTGAMWISLLPYPLEPHEELVFCGGVNDLRDLDGGERVSLVIVPISVELRSRQNLFAKLFLNRILSQGWRGFGAVGGT